MRLAWGGWPYAGMLARRRARELRDQKRRVGRDGWTCHVCGDYRPDAQISVFKRRHSLPGGVVMDENVRYCNDRPLCAEAAKTKTFLAARA